MPKKPVKAKPRSAAISPREGRITNAGARHSTGSAGRAYPANVDKVSRRKGNPPGAPRKVTRSA